MTRSIIKSVYTAHRIITRMINYYSYLLRSKYELHFLLSFFFVLTCLGATLCCAPKSAQRPALYNTPATARAHNSVIFIYRKCRNNEAAYPAFGLENAMKLEHLTAHWTWPGMSRAISDIRVDLKGLKILTPDLRQRLQDLLHACGLNLTAHRVMVPTYSTSIVRCTHCSNFSFLYPYASEDKGGDFTRLDF